MIAARNGDDLDGRTDTIVIGARDNIGNIGSCSAVVTCHTTKGTENDPVPFPILSDDKSMLPSSNRIGMKGSYRSLPKSSNFAS